MRSRAIGDVRPSQVITTFGPGAIVDLQTLSIIVGSIDAWPTEDAIVIREPRLERALGLQKLIAAKPAEGDPPYRRGTVPSYVFPRFQVCPVCKAIAEIGTGEGSDAVYVEDEKAIVCRTPGCKGVGGGKRQRRAQMVPAPFVIACPSGHLDDFPWRQYAHRGPTSCSKRMRLVSRGETGTVSDLWIICDCKNGSRSMSDAFGENASQNIGRCGCSTPWVRPGAREQRCETPDQVRTIQRGATNGWFPIVKSALAIGDSADPVAIAIGRCNEHQISRIDSFEKLKMYTEDRMFQPFEGLEPEDIWRKLQEMRGERPPQEEDLRWPEWLTLRDPEERDQGWGSELHLERGEVPLFANGLISQVVLARRLLEVRALTSFTRVDNLGGIPDDEEAVRRTMPVYQRGHRPDWLPGVEVRGEGIFIEFSEDALQAWEQKTEVMARSSAMAQKHEQWERDRGREPSPFPGARFAMIHTLAHALIRQLSLDCGYPAASVRERIYSSLDPDRRMAGVLLYTASPDSEGSLGGLVDLGTPGRLPALLGGALRELTRCSSDPLCADHEPDAHATINGAACHACSLVSETSCEIFNLFLDRTLVVPTMAHDDMAFFPYLGMP